MIPDNRQFQHQLEKLINIHILNYWLINFGMNEPYSQMKQGKQENYYFENFLFNITNFQRDVIVQGTLYYESLANTFKLMDIEAYEKIIEQNSCDLERISILQRKSRTRLQLVNLLNHSFIRSINDKQKNLRLLLFGLLRSIYALKDVQIICIIKQVVYSSSLSFITNSNGVLKEELHRIMCENFRKIQQESENELEDALLRSFNCVAFFDQILLTSFKEYFKPNYADSLPQWIKFIQQHFSFSMKVNEGTKQDEQQEQHSKRQLWFQWVVDGLYLPSVNQQNIPNPDIQELSRQSFEEVTYGQKKNFMAVAIQSCDSPTFKKQNSNKLNFSSNKKNLFNSRVEITQSKAQTRQEKRSFWSLFCCTD